MSVPHELPEGTLHIQDFLSLHNLKQYRRRIIGYLDIPRHNLRHHAIPKASRPDETDRYLTHEQQEALLTWLKEKHPDIFQS